MNHLIDSFDFGSSATGRSSILAGPCLSQHRDSRKLSGHQMHRPTSTRHIRWSRSLTGRRVSGMEHDFLTFQPVHGADVYLFR